jgi:hypothetical protein
VASVFSVFAKEKDRGLLSVDCSLFTVELLVHRKIVSCIKFMLSTVKIQEDGVLAGLFVFSSTHAFYFEKTSA